MRFGNKSESHRLVTLTRYRFSAVPTTDSSVQADAGERRWIGAQGAPTVACQVSEVQEIAAGEWGAQVYAETT